MKAGNIVKRLLITLPVLWLIVTAVFLLIRLVPGDPIVQMLGEGATAADISTLRHAYGFDLPLQTQYWQFLKGVSHGDLGRSVRLREGVMALIGQRYPYTLELTAAAMFIGILFSVPAGIWSAYRNGTRVDRTIGVASLFGLSLPNFALGPVLILVFAIWLGWLPVSGAGTGWQLITHLVLPAVTLGSGLAATLTRMVRTSVLEELGKDYLRTDRAKGLPERTVVWHAFRNALVPVLTVVGLQFGSLLAGAIVTETIFSWPGLGRLTISAISNRDYPLVQGCILAIGVTYVAVNLLTDLTYRMVNPRMRSA
ncbi:ABC transporter permease [Terriglobus sp. 2YAB30_2]|uniref:ABC transporter permease n=1 Tax=Terriglobus sp. 2YAB30_2 TaxID=3233023 RepID=UPI003F972997